MVSQATTRHKNLARQKSIKSTATRQAGSHDTDVTFRPFGYYRSRSPDQHPRRRCRTGPSHQPSRSTLRVAKGRQRKCTPRTVADPPYRLGLIEQDRLPLLARPEPNAPVVALFELGAIARLGECSLEWCYLRADGYKGWAPKARLWGVGAQEIRD